MLALVVAAMLSPGEMPDESLIFAADALCVALPRPDRGPRGAAASATAANDLLLSELRRRRQSLGLDAQDQWQVDPACSSRDVPSIRLAVVTSGVASAEQSPCSSLLLGAGPESFSLCTVALSPSAHAVELHVVARGDRALMLAVGRLLRELEISSSGALVLPNGPLALSVEPPSFGRIRGHQLTDWGFYMTTSSFEQFAKDLLIFGTNQVEFAHIDYSRGDAHKLVEWSAILDKYDMRVSLFNPPFGSAADQATTREIFANMTRVDSFFQEGPSAAAFPALQQAVAALREHHPQASAWVSPCGLDESALDAWFRSLASSATQAWLTGVCYGPGVHISMVQMVERLPPGYELRQYPDISHSLAAMYPQPNWHRAWAFSHGRLAINPSPRRFGDIAVMNMNATYSQRAIGFGAYSEGACDDLNKMLWSALYTEPKLTIDEFITQYSRHFLPSTEPGGAQAAAELLRSLERNWDGDALDNPAVNISLALAQELEHNAVGRTGTAAASDQNWRLQAYLFRANYDGFVQVILSYRSS